MGDFSRFAALRDRFRGRKQGRFSLGRVRGDRLHFERPFDARLPSHRREGKGAPGGGPGGTCGAGSPGVRPTNSAEEPEREQPARRSALPGREGCARCRCCGPVCWSNDRSRARGPRGRPRPPLRRSRPSRSLFPVHPSRSARTRAGRKPLRMPRSSATFAGRCPTGGEDGDPSGQWSKRRTTHAPTFSQPPEPTWTQRPAWSTGQPKESLSVPARAFADLTGRLGRVGPVPPQMEKCGHGSYPPDWHEDGGQNGRAPHFCLLAAAIRRRQRAGRRPTGDGGQGPPECRRRRHRLRCVRRRGFVGVGNSWGDGVDERGGGEAAGGPPTAPASWRRSPLRPSPAG